MVSDQDTFANLLYGVSHDLGAPLRHVSEFSKLLRHSAQDRLSEKELQWLDFMQSAGEQSQQMLQGLLSASRILSDSDSNLTEDCSLQQVVEDCWQQLLQPHASGASRDVSRITFTNLTDGHRLSANSTMLSQCLHELLCNAVYFQQPGDHHPCWIRVEAHEDEVGVLLRVIDNGIGIDEKLCQNIMRPFKRLRPDLHPNGLGLGLFVAQVCAQKMGASLSITGNAWQGTTAELKFTRTRNSGRKESQ